jgi:hypothetical protein
MLGRVAKQILGATQDVFRGFVETAGLSERITAAEDAKARNTANYLIPMQRFYEKRIKPLSRKNQEALNTEITEHVRAREMGEPLVPLSDLAKDYMTLTQRLTERVQRDRERLNVHVRTSSGKVRPTGRIGAQYWPRRLRRDVREALEAGRSSPEWQRLEREAIRAGDVKDAAEFREKFEAHDVPSTEAVADSMSNMDRAREARLPLSMYDFSPTAMLDYLGGAAKRLAEIEFYGQRIRDDGRDAFLNAIEAINQSADLSREQKINLARSVQTARRNAYGGVAPSLIEKTGRTVRTAVSGLGLGQYLSAAKDLVSSNMQTLAYQGFRPWLSAWRHVLSPSNWKSFSEDGKRLGRTWSAIREAEEKGAIAADITMMRDIMGEDVSPEKLGWGTKLTEKTMRLSLRNASDRFTRGFSYVAAQAHLRQVLKAMRKGGLKEQLAREFAGRRFTDADQLLAENGKGPMTDRFLRQSVKDFMGGYTPSQSPPWMEGDMQKFLFQFQRWGYNAARQYVREVVLPMHRAIQSGDRSRFVGALLKALMVAGVQAGSGELNKFLTTLMRGGGISDPSFAELGKLLMKGDGLQFSQKLGGRLLDDVFAGGALGWLGAPFALQKTLTEIPKVSRGRELNDVPGYTTVIKALTHLGRWGARASAGGGGPTPDEFKRALEDLSSQVRLGIDLGARLGIPAEPFMTERARQDVNWARNQVRKFEKANPVFLARAAKRPMIAEAGISPIPGADLAREEITNALIRGDPRTARIRAERFARTQPEPKETLKGIAQSMRARSPIAPGGSYSKDTQELVEKWARRTLGAHDAQRLHDLGARYQRSLEAAGFGAKEH